MDYRHTEDFARAMERSARRAHLLRDEAIDALFARFARGLRAAAHGAWSRIVHSCRNFLPEA